MISQIIKNEEELKKLIINELESKGLSNNQHGNNSEEELQIQIDNFIENEGPKSYPVFLFAEFRYIYNGFSISLYSSSFYLTKENILKLLEDL